MPNMRTQLVAARAVAEVLADLATRPAPPDPPRPAPPDPPGPGLPDPARPALPDQGDARFLEVAGPREESLVEMATVLASRRGYPARIEGVSDPADPDGELNTNGALLPGPGARLVGPTFEEWLDSAS